MYEARVMSTCFQNSMHPGDMSHENMFPTLWYQATCPCRTCPHTRRRWRSCHTLSQLRLQRKRTTRCIYIQGSCNLQGCHSPAPPPPPFPENALTPAITGWVHTCGWNGHSHVWDTVNVFSSLVCLIIGQHLVVPGFFACHLKIQEDRRQQLHLINHFIQASQ